MLTTGFTLWMRNSKLLILLFLMNGVSHAQENYAVKMADSFMQWHPDSIQIKEDKPARWDYEQGLILKALERVWFRTGNPKYFNYIKKDIDRYVLSSGEIKTYKYEDFNLDNISTGRALLMLYQCSLADKEKYKIAADELWKQIENQPKTKSGGYWHKKRYPNQMWLDGLFMAEPFAAEYSSVFKHPEHFQDIFRQFELIEKHAVDSETGLLFHGYDESRKMAWADKTSGVSPNFWARGIGWYAMALVEVLDYFPEDNPQRQVLISYLQRLAPILKDFQDSKTGLWFQVINLQERDGNYLEASASCMFTYTLAKAARLGYIPKEYMEVAKKAYSGILKNFIEKETDGSISLNKTVSVGGLGGEPYRDGSFEYYISEPIRKNDLKGVGPFILASIEMEIAKESEGLKPKKVALDYYFNREFRKDLNGETEQFHYTWEDRLHSGFWIWGQIFKEYGAGLGEIEHKPSYSGLKDFDVFIIVDPDTPKETEHPNYIEKSDIKNIKKWVKKGGTLILMANDTTNCEVKKFNELGKAFGIEFSMKNLNFVSGKNYEMANAIIEKGNEVFKNTSKVYLKEVVSLKLSGNAKAVVIKGEDILMATAKYGKGKVFVVGDPWLYNEYVDGRIIGTDFQNFQAAKDLAKWALE